MIEDPDGEANSSTPGVQMRIASLALIGAALVGWMAASSPWLRGPFAEPRPSPSPAARYTPAPTDRIEPAGFFGTVRGCIAPGAVTGTTVFVNGRSVTFQRPIATSPWSCAAPAEFFPRPGGLAR